MSKKKENFKRLAEARTNKVIDMLQLIGNLSNTSNYEYTAQEVHKIFDSILTEIERQRKKFKENSAPKKRFRL